MTNMEGFTALQCTCGGSIKFTPAQMDNMFIETNGAFVFIGSGTSEKFKCEYCGKEFIRKQSYQPSQPTNVSVGARGVYLGNSSGNVVITGNGNVFGNGNKVDGWERQ